MYIYIYVYVSIYIYVYIYTYLRGIHIQPPSSVTYHPICKKHRQNMSTSLATVMIAHTETGVSLIWEDYDLSTMIFQQTILPLRVDFV